MSDLSFLPPASSILPMSCHPSGKVGVGIHSIGDVNVSGSLTATNLTGAGANITNLNASNLVLVLYQQLNSQIILTYLVLQQ